MTSEETEARERLLFHLENQTGFWFALVVGDDVGPRARLREAAKSWCAENGREFILHEPGPERLAALALDLAKEPKSGLHWIRADGPQGLLEQWDAAAAQLLLTMNERREAYRKRLDGGVLIEGRESLKRLLRDLAPDLFTIRAFIAEPGAAPKIQERAPLEWRLPASILARRGVEPDPDRAIHRLAQLKGLTGVEANKQWSDAALAAVGSLIKAGRFDEAARWVSEIVKEEKQRPVLGRSEDARARLLIVERLVQSMAAYANDKRDVALERLNELRAAVDSYIASNQVKAHNLDFIFVVLHKFRADLLSSMGNYDEAVDALEAHLRIIEGTLAREPSNMAMRLELLDTFRALSDVWKERKDLTQAETASRRALEIADKSASEHPEDERWQIELARAWRDLGWILGMRGDPHAALEAIGTAVSVADQHVTHDASNRDWQDELAGGSVLKCLLLFEMGILGEEHLPTQARALAFSLSSYEQDHDDDELGWIVVILYAYRASILAAKGDTAGMREAADQAWPIVKRLPVRSRDERELRRTVNSIRSKPARQSKKK